MKELFGGLGLGAVAIMATILIIVGIASAWDLVVWLFVEFIASNRWLGLGAVVLNVAWITYCVYAVFAYTRVPPDRR